MATSGARAQALLYAADSAKLNRAQYDWIMHCQGCHGTEAQGTPGGAPKLAGHVALFLHSNEGRQYLGRVPGVAFVNLPDAEVAELLTWIVQHFDATHVPKTFTPYSAQEIHALRGDPLISRAYLERQKLLKSLPKER